MSQAPLQPLYRLDASSAIIGIVLLKAKANHRYYIRCQANRKPGTIAFVDATLTKERGGPMEGNVWTMVTYKPNQVVPLSSVLMEDRGTECVVDPDMAVSHFINC